MYTIFSILIVLYFTKVLFKLKNDSIKNVPMFFLFYFTSN
jgi:hypothetical protein